MSHICQLIWKKELAYQLGPWIGYRHSTQREICCQLMDIKVNRMSYISRANRLDMIYIRDLQLAKQDVQQHPLA